jgi:hypothetical protein
MKPKSITLAFKRWFGEAGFGELMVFDFWFVESPSCDLVRFCVRNETEKRHLRLQVLV